MGNEVEITVTATDQTGPVKDELKASWQAFEKTFQPLGLRATNPINDAFMAEVKASIKSLSGQALEIPVDADTMPFLEQVETVLQELASTTRADIPLEVGNAIAFREQVLEQVEAVSNSVKAVIDIEVNDQGLTDLQAKTMAASQATTDMVAAQQKLNSALASGDDEQIAKARLELADATKTADDATMELTAAEAAAAEGAVAVAAATDTATVSSRGLNAAMGPLWMVMNVAQIAMMGLYTTSNSTSSATQNLTQQIVSLGNATGQSAAGMLAGNSALSTLNDQLNKTGTSSVEFATAAIGGVTSFTSYLNGLNASQKQVASTMVTLASSQESYNKSASESGTMGLTKSVKELDQALKDGTVSYNNLSTPQKNLVDEYRAFAPVLGQANDELKQLKAQQDLETQQLAATGFTMSTAQSAANDYGTSIQQLAKDFADATSGAKYMEDSQDQASIAAGQGVQSWKQLQAAVTQAQQSYDQAAQGVSNAGHSVVTASQSVASAQHSEEQAANAVQTAMHSEQQAVLATEQAQRSYTESVYQEAQAQQAVTAARAAAEQQLISLQLQANDAAASAESAGLALYKAQQAAAGVGVNPGNAQQIAGEQITAQNEAQVEAAIALIQAENQVADAQNSSTTAQSGLNTARQQGVDGNPAVLSAEHSLSQAQQGVEQAAQGVTNAQYAETQAVQGVTNAQWAQHEAALQVGNAEWSLHAAGLAVTQAEQAEKTATDALNAARDNESRSVDANTLKGAQNRQQLEAIFEAYEKVSPSEQIAAEMTQKVGQQMGFTSGQIGDVLGSLNGLNGTDTQFSITGTPSMNPQQLVQVGNELGLSFAQIEATLPMQHVGTGRLQAAGGPGGGLTWVGEQGPELVHLPYGTEVMPHANSMQQVALKQVIPPGHASGGPVGGLATPTAALGADIPITAQWGAVDVVGQMLHAMGGPPMVLPPASSTVDLGPFAGWGGGGGGGGGSVAGVRGSEAANRAIVMSIFASMFGWGSAAEQSATDYVMMRESGYNNLAQNPTSTAFGMFQFLNSTWAGYGIGKTADPTGQTIAGGRYMAARYHDPIGAAAHERAFNWYGAAGPVGGDGWIGVGEYGPELLHVPGGSSVRPTASIAAPTTPAGGQVEITFGGADSAFSSFFKQLVRTGQIRIAVNNVNAVVG